MQESSESIGLSQGGTLSVGTMHGTGNLKGSKQRMFLFENM